jgi:hypothetical protein
MVFFESAEEYSSHHISLLPFDKQFSEVREFQMHHLNLLEQVRYSYSSSRQRLAHGPQKYTVFANEKLNDDFAKATVARLLRSYGA